MYSDSERGHVSTKVRPGACGQAQERGCICLSQMEVGMGDLGTGPTVRQLPQSALRVTQPCPMPFHPQQDLLCARPTLSPSEVPNIPQGPSPVP